MTVNHDDDIMQHRRIAVLELLQKHIRIRDLSGLIDPLVTLLQSGYTEGTQLGEQRGIQQGKIEGEREATLKIACRMEVTDILY